MVQSDESLRKCMHGQGNSATALNKRLSAHQSATSVRQELDRFTILCGSQHIPPILTFIAHACNTLTPQQTRTHCGSNCCSHGTSWQQQGDKGFKQLPPQVQIPTRSAHQTFWIRSNVSSSCCTLCIHAMKFFGRNLSLCWLTVPVSPRHCKEPSRQLRLACSSGNSSFSVKPPFCHAKKRLSPREAPLYGCLEDVALVLEVHLRVPKQINHVPHVPDCGKSCS